VTVDCLRSFEKFIAKTLAEADIKTKLEQGGMKHEVKLATFPLLLRETQVKHHNNYEVQSHGISESGAVTSWRWCAALSAFLPLDNIRAEKQWQSKLS
jgi:hypothetical protein